MARLKKAASAATLGFEATLWAAADKFRHTELIIRSDI